MGYKAYSDSYLMSLTKAQIIELLRVAEHNFFATEEALNNSVKAGMEIAKKYDEAKKLLKAAIEDLSDTAAEAYNGRVICKCCKWLAETVYCKCPNDGGCDTTYQWRYADEALKLIGDSENDEP